VTNLNNSDSHHQKMLELYALVIKEEQYFISEHQNRVAFFSGLISALLGGTVLGIFSAKEWYHFAILMIAPLTIVAVSIIAIMATRRPFQRFLETVTMKAKIEHDLGYAKPRGRIEPGEYHRWVASEPLVSKRHLDSRNDPTFSTSQQWVTAHLNKWFNYQGVAKLIFGISIAVGSVLFLVVFIVAFVKVFNNHFRHILDISRF
jgi:hypothetical protein